MTDITVLRTLTRSRLVEAVDNSVNSAYFVTDLDTTRSFYAIDGMSGKKYRFLINTLVKSLGDVAYLEVGSWAGSAFCSAIHGNKVRAVAIDNWSQCGGPKNMFYHNLGRILTPESRVYVIDGDFRNVDYEAIGLFDIYFLDGPHDERDQYDGLKLVLNALGPEFVFIVDDWNWLRVSARHL